MIESLFNIFGTGDFWGIVLKALFTALITGVIGLICTLIGSIIAKSKTSKLKHHAKIAVEAAEQKFPNEGTKMGPEKIAYVMDYLAITFPKIKSNQYLYNIAEAAVFALNKEKEEEAAKKQFIEKYGELPETLNEYVDTDTDINTDVIEDNINNENSIEEAIPQEAIINPIATTEIKKETKKITNIF